MRDPAPAGYLATLRLDADRLIIVTNDDARADAVAAVLRAADPLRTTIFLPSSDALPGDAIPASAGNIGQRVAGLRQLGLASGKRALVLSAEAAAARVAPPTAFDTAPPSLSVDDAFDVERLGAMIAAIGYVDDDRVDEPGEMAVHGQTVEVFPADAGMPVRIEVADGRILAIRRYDPLTQLSMAELDTIEIGRVEEPILGDAGVSVFSHLTDAVVLVDADVGRRRDRYVRLVRETLRDRPATVEKIVTSDTEWAAAMAGSTLIQGHTDQQVVRFVEQRDPLRAFVKFARAESASGRPVVLVGAARDLRFIVRRAIKALKVDVVEIAAWGDATDAALYALPVSADQGWRGDAVTAVAAADLLGSRAGAERGAATDPSGLFTDEVRIGDLVVHESFGIGRVGGIEPLSDGGDAIVLEYAAGGRRLVPVAEAPKIWRYGGDADAVTLDKLDGSSWDKRRSDIDVAIAESARALLQLTQARAAASAPVIEPDAAAYERFAATFAFTETADQQRAITAVRDDLASGTPMDRLIIGDVGYGKTEVALRAAAIVALAGKQVAIAVPTTVLVRQHLESFQRRFDSSGIKVAALSRLSTGAEKKAVKAGLADGSISIVIGTGAIAAKGIRYHDLALAIVDEEQRFGTADKQALRALGAAHALTLSATPIPRTLQTALVGLQDLSIIATPPARRQPIRTSVGPFDDAAVRAALLRERSRRGQSFVVVPRIDDMARVRARLAELVPDLRVIEAHGKLPAVDIDAAMVGFADGEGDILLATNIIETGLDVPRANTMVIWRADRFGLAQLHQLRGRVGRGGRRGQVMLTSDPATTMAPATLKRLATLQAFDRLGAGFAIAARDLDLRGGGDLTGDAQAGHLKLIGVDLYQHLLESAVRAARGEIVERWTPELNLGLDGCLADDWMPDIGSRLSAYWRIARADAAGLTAIEDELEDRFGTLPGAALHLFAIARLRLVACDLGIARVDAGPAAIALTARPGTELTAAGLEPAGDRFLLKERIADADARLTRVEALLEALG